MNDVILERAAEAAYAAHHEGMDDIAWQDMPDWMKERWRWAAKAVIALIEERQPRHPLIRTA